MKTNQSNDNGQVSIEVMAYNDCDDVYLCWRVLNNKNEDAQIDGSLGFKIERQRLKDEQWQSSEILRNRVGFKDIEDIDENDPNQISKPSSVWPFQRYDWTDHGANANETVRYRVTAMGNIENVELGQGELSEIISSDWSQKIDVNADAGNGISVFFNRGIVMSQFVARMARAHNWSASDIKEHVTDIKEPLRIFLSGDLRSALLNILDDAINNTIYSLYMALYELSDTEFISKLTQLGSRANIVLSDGSNTKKNDGHVIYVDENEKSRKTIKDAGVIVYDRMLKSQGLGHNKFLIIVDNRTDTPVSVWTGSTNWSPTGLCTQLNNGIKIEDTDVATIFYNQWKNLRDAKSDFPNTLVASNSKSPKSASNVDVWFTRVEKPDKGTPYPIDIAALIELVNEAEKNILFVMFQPGAEPLNTIIKKRGDPSMYVRGVVNTLSQSNQEKFELTNGKSTNSSYTSDVIQPEGVGKNFDWWVKEVTRGEFLPGIGFAITHAKVIVIDPFTDKCKVITGSHNFSQSASLQNDENFIVIQGNKKLAEHYAVACMSIYNHYRWRAYLKDKSGAGEAIWSHLSNNPQWQSDYLASERLIQHLNVWCPVLI